MSLDNVVEALNTLLSSPNTASSADDGDSSQGDSTKLEDFFCVDDSLLARDVKVSVDKVGSINYPIPEDVIKKLIDISEKAKFGRRLETVLDTSYRDTQMIPAEKLKVDISKQALDTLLQRIGQELNIEQHSKLEIHLYNMLIYGPGQFFKRHRDTEKVPNMIATLVMVLPSPHKGGDLIIQHHSLKHKFFGSLNPEIIKCVTFYSNCFHEVKKVDEGYRVALTYNVELKSGPIPDLMAVDRNLLDAVNEYFEESESDMLVYYLDHQYTEHSLRWYMLKGSDRICAKALLAVGKLQGHPPYLALVEYHETYQEDCEEDMEKETELYFWMDENNIQCDCGRISVSEDEICFMKDTKEEFDPYKREEEGNMGNWSGNIDEWYHRSAVVLWRDTWAFVDGFKKECRALHLLTEKPGMEKTLLEKLTNCSDRIFSSKFWKNASVKKMALDIMMYIKNHEMTLKILSKLKPSDVLDLGKNEVVSWIASNCDLEIWKGMIKAWKTRGSEDLLECLLPFLLSYMTKEDKDVGVAEYLLDESAKFSKAKNFGSGNSSDKDKRLCSLLQISFQLGKLDLEKDLMKNVNYKSSEANFEMFEKALHPEQFARISADLLLHMANATLSKIQKEKYIYSTPKPNYIQEICSLLKTCGEKKNREVEQKIFSHMMSKPGIYTASFHAELLVKMREVLGAYVSNYTDYKSYALNMIEAELRKLKNPNDCSLPISHPCNCEYCSQIQRFFASATQMQVIIPTAKHNRAHIYGYLNPFAEYMPIKLETIRTGSPYKLTVTKLPKLLQDRQNLIKRLVEAKNTIVQAVSVEPDRQQPAKKQKTK